MFACPSVDRKNKNRIPLGAEVRPRCGRDARVTVGQPDGAEAVRRASAAMITKVSQARVRVHPPIPMIVASCAAGGSSFICPRP